MSPNAPGIIRIPPSKADPSRPIKIVDLSGRRD